MFPALKQSRAKWDEVELNVDNEWGNEEELLWRMKRDSEKEKETDYNNIQEKGK